MFSEFFYESQSRHKLTSVARRVVTVSLTRYSVDTILPAFANCLSHLPNLHTLRVCHAHSQMTTALKDAFHSKRYPQMRTIIVPSCAHNILRACPNVVDVTCNEDDGSKLLTAITKECKKVEILDGFRFYSEAMVKRESVVFSPSILLLTISKVCRRLSLNCESSVWARWTRCVPYDRRASPSELTSASDSCRSTSSARYPFSRSCT